MHDAPQLSRRRLLRVALGAGVGIGLGRFASVAAEEEIAFDAEDGPFPEETSGALNDGGTALQPAQRVSQLPPPIVPVEPPPDGKLIFPIQPESDCYVLDNFGDCRGSGCSRLHEGVDIMGSRDQPLVAVANGRLTKRYEDSGLTYGAGHGWSLVDDENGRLYKYFHMARHEEGLEEGDEVQLGQVIGYVGNTGTSGVPSDSNYHLHFEVRDLTSDNDWESVAVDPLPLLVVDDKCDISPPIKA